MIIGSHNSWSYLRPKKWWMRLIAFTAKCQRHSIAEQYLVDDVRCFDLHIRINKLGVTTVVHGPIEYCNLSELFDLFRFFNERGNVYVRMLLDVRTKYAMADYDNQAFYFGLWCEEFERTYPNITFWCGRMVKGWRLAYKFRQEPTCDEMYGSVMKPKWFWGIYPWLYAKIHNRKNLTNGTESDIMLIDYVDIK